MSEMLQNEKGSLRDPKDVGYPCVSCSIKHLQAAIADAYVSRSPRNPVRSCKLSGYSFVRAQLSSAYIALGEFSVGYESHFDYAVGLMASAETCLSAFGMNEEASNIRKIRLALASGGETSSAMLSLASDVGIDAAYGNLMEAYRESEPEYLEDIAGVIAKYEDSGFGKTEEFFGFVRDACSLVRKMRNSVYRGGDHEYAKAEGKEVK